MKTPDLKSAISPFLALLLPFFIAGATVLVVSDDAKEADKQQIKNGLSLEIMKSRLVDVSVGASQHTGQLFRDLLTR